mmetsp:Transcript_2031/g.7339  ORF Transcript_2031/g.7339 Transcript_2031/m.7339 type:complete len:301 (+) Transcript_2031:2686-3588(+)
MLSHARQSWLDFCTSLFVEARQAGCRGAASRRRLPRVLQLLRQLLALAAQLVHIRQRFVHLFAPRRPRGCWCVEARAGWRAQLHRGRRFRRSGWAAGTGHAGGREVALGLLEREQLRHEVGKAVNLRLRRALLLDECHQRRNQVVHARHAAGGARELLEILKERVVVAVPVVRFALAHLAGEEGSFGPAPRLRDTEAVEVAAKLLHGRVELGLAQLMLHLQRLVQLAVVLAQLERRVAPCRPNGDVRVPLEEELRHLLVSSTAAVVECCPAFSVDLVHICVVVEKHTNNLHVPSMRGVVE